MIMSYEEGEEQKRDGDERKQRERHKQRSKGVLQDLTSNCNIHNTGNILNSIIPVLYQSIVTCMHEINYAIVQRTLLYQRYQHK